MTPFNSGDVKVIIGLGNPGPTFHWTRHNIGFLFVDALAQQHGVSWRTVGNVLVATLSSSSGTIMLVKPQTFMNNSGDCVPALLKKGIRAEQILVVHDELEKKFGTHQIRLGGSARGHNGLRSLVTRLGEGFWRLRLGIDRPAERDAVAQYVLAPFTPEEKARLDAVFQAAQLLLKID